MKNSSMKRAATNEPTPPDMERVQLMVTGAAVIDVFMPTGDADSVDEEDPGFIDEAVEAAGVDLFNDLDFEVDVLGVVEPRRATRKATG